MRIQCVAFTEKGADLAAELCNMLRLQGMEASGCSVKEHPLLQQVSGTASHVAEHFHGWDAWIFVGACGIAVRIIAPLLKNKTQDPAVLVVDETARFVIPLVSGHIGGANRLARIVADWLHAQPVITTATDCRGVFAVDTWAVSQGLYIVNPESIRQISGALLAGQTVGFCSRIPWKGPLPEGLVHAREGEIGICVGPERPFAKTLQLLPREYIVGLGCRRGVSPEMVEEKVLSMLQEHSLQPEQVFALATIDRKKEEPAFTRLATRWRIPLETWTAEELSALPGEYSGSAFVQQTVGVDNVCERAAMMRGGRLIQSKLSGDGVTVAMSHIDRSLRFHDTNGIDQP